MHLLIMTVYVNNFIRPTSKYEGQLESNRVVERVHDSTAKEQQIFIM